ncbi:MAG: VOC family protein [Jatrophihabitantaceae bacterium]
MALTAAISLVTLGVSDVAASTRFYQALGFPLSSASVPGEVSFFRTAGGLLGLYGADALADDASVPRTAAAGFRGVSLAINLPGRADVDAALLDAEAAGARVLKPAQATEWGGYHAYFADPDGHAWEIAHNPFWPLDDAGLPVLPPPAGPA